MSLRLNHLLKLKPFMVGMIHLRALPGCPSCDPYHMPFSKVCDVALEEASVLDTLGIDGLVIENMHDVPYLIGDKVGPEIVASMTKVSSLIRKELSKEKPIGIQILAGANRQAVAVAAAADLDFVRVEGFVFSHIADEGFFNSCAADLLRFRKSIGAEHIAIFADIKKKHSSHAVTADVSHSQVAEAARFFKADGVIVTGTATGHAPSPMLLREIVSAVGSYPVLVGSGVDIGNVKDFCEAGVSGLIVGSTFKEGGKWENKIDPTRVKAMIQRVQELRGEL